LVLLGKVVTVAQVLMEILVVAAAVVMQLVELWPLLRVARAVQVVLTLYLEVL
jgi:hypothetical protein